MSVDLDELEAKAKAETPGEWRSSPYDERRSHIFSFPAVNEVVEAAKNADAAFIAAANPAVVLELLRRLRAAEAIVGDLAKRDPVQHFPSRCPLCIGHVLVDPPDRSMVGAFVHDETCVYRRSVEATPPHPPSSK